MNISSIPDVITFQIFDYLPYHQRINMMKCNEHFYKYSKSKNMNHFLIHCVRYAAYNAYIALLECHCIFESFCKCQKSFEDYVITLNKEFYDEGLFYAGFYGKNDLISYYIYMGANNWNSGLKGSAM